jgi:NAD(P)-dependent dehydrogenase (short-subunit alcohol dehydrogenase family)
MAKDLAGKHIVITGANTGIGRATAAALAARGAELTLACRSEAKTAPVIDALRAETGNPAIHFLALDLGRLASVREAAAALLAGGKPIHVLLNNAGVGGQRGATADGYEIHFGTNHLAHFLWTQLLLDRVKASAPARIVNVSSRSHYRAKAIPWDALRRPTRSITGMPEYEVSKLCNVLHAGELARRLEGTGVTTYSLHPGVIASDIWRRIPPPFRQIAKALFMKSTEEGATASIRCAADPALAGESGRYYTDDGSERRPNRLARDGVLAGELWTRSEAMLA